MFGFLGKGLWVEMFVQEVYWWVLPGTMSTGDGWEQNWAERQVELQCSCNKDLGWSYGELWNGAAIQSCPHWGKGAGLCTWDQPATGCELSDTAYTLGYSHSLPWIDNSFWGGSQLWTIKLSTLSVAAEWALVLKGGSGGHTMATTKAYFLCCFV